MNLISLQSEAIKETLSDLLLSFSSVIFIGTVVAFSALDVSRVSTAIILSVIRLLYGILFFKLSVTLKEI